MSFGRMNTFIDIISTEPVKDDEGFVTSGEHILASVRAYKEERHSNERWANMAAFSSATALVRFRYIHGLAVTTAMFIRCDGERYNIISVDNVRGRNMYIEVLVDKTEPSVR